MFSRLNRTVWIVAFVACLSGSTSVHPQALNPPYLSEMPVPARVVAEIQGKDAEDTGERQMGAFVTLVQTIDDMAWGIGHRYVNTADSTRAVSAGTVICSRSRQRAACRTCSPACRATVASRSWRMAPAWRV